jgi:hypothetical protein
MAKRELEKEYPCIIKNNHQSSISEISGKRLKGIKMKMVSHWRRA